MDASVTGLADHQEIDAYGDSLEAFLAQQIDADRFTSIRLQMGIYGQRQDGVNMVRIKVPGGRLNAAQLERIGEVLERYARHDVVHITTRQDIQVHYIPLADTPAVLRRLAEVGLTTREACGNTIRNITACSLAGICPREHVDIRTHVDGAVGHFLRNPLNQQLPRKFKVSFSGCEADCAQGLLHDLAVVAVREGTRFGFRVLAGGGLGHKPHQAIVVERFIEEKDLLLTMEAVVALHNRYSDRTKRAKSRIKFLVDRFGAEGFVEKYREELSRTRNAMAQKPYPRGDWNGGVDGDSPGPGAPRTLFAQKQAGLRVVPMSVPLGNLSATQLRGLAVLLNDYGLTEIRTTQDQNLLIPDVPAQQVERLLGAASRLGFGLPQSGDNVVACPGTSTCRLGITSSTIVAPKLSGGRHDLRIRVSGCHNGCAQPETGDIGIYGEGRRLHGKLVPHYQTYFGGNGMGGGRLAVKGPSVPTARVETVITRVTEAFDAAREPGETFSSWTHRQAPDYFRTLLADLTEVRPEDVVVLARDHGDEVDFRVLQLGGGECAGATQVQIGSAFFEAAHERGYRDALLAQQKLPEAAACAAAIGRLIGQGLTQLFGGKKADSLALQAEELRRVAPDHAALADALAQFDAALGEQAVAAADAQELRILFAQIDVWTLRAAQASMARDTQLDLSGALPKAAAAQPLRYFRTAVA